MENVCLERLLQMATQQTSAGLFAAPEILWARQIVLYNAAR